MKSILRSSILSIASTIAMGISAAPAQAIGILLTSDLGYTGPTLDLSAYATGDNNYTNGRSPIPGGIIFTSTVVGGSTLGQNNVGSTYSLGSNGEIDDVPVFAGLDGATGYMAFSFRRPIAQFGAYLNYAPLVGSPAQIGVGGSPTIATYNTAGSLLSSFDLESTPGGQISTPSGLNQFAFRGISEGAKTISSFRLSGGYIVATERQYVADTPIAVPEPITGLAAIIGSTIGLVLRGRLKK